MKSVLFFLASAAAVVAQDFTGEPACATPCLTSAISKAGCAINDVSCQCGPTKSAIATLVAGCLISNCNSSDLAQAESAGEAICSSLSSASVTMTSNTTTTSAAVSTTTASNGTAIIVSTSSGFSNSTMTSSSAAGSSSAAATTTTTEATGTGGSGSGSSTASASQVSSSAGAGVVGLSGGLLAGILGLMAAL